MNRAAGAAAPQAAAEPALEFKGPTWFSRTTDGGKTWETARPIYDPGNNAQTIGNQIIVLPNGRVFDFFTNIDADGNLTLQFIGSGNKGQTWSKPTLVADRNDAGTAVTPDAQEPLRDADILFDVAVDSRNGRLYAVFQDAGFSGFTEVGFTQSLDGGKTWSKPVKINLTPRNKANPLRAQAFIPSVAVAGDGSVAVTYYDFRNDFGGARESTDYFALFCHANCTAIASWGQEQRLTVSPFDALDAPEAGGHFLGDYMGLATAGQDVYPVFTIATRPNVTNVYVRKVTLPAAVATTAAR